MTNFTRMLSAIFAILFGLQTIIFSLLQSVTTVGYDNKPTELIAQSYLAGSDTFKDETESDNWSVGYAKRVLTPDDVKSHKYFIAGFLKFPAQEVTGVIDDLSVRAVCLDDNTGSGVAAFAWVDGVGLMNADIKEIRKALSDITGEGKLISIDVGSTHTHSGIDTQGLWGNIPKSGRDQKYIDILVKKTAEAIREAYETRTSGELYYASDNRAEMFEDASRKPVAFDEKIHLFHFVPDNKENKEIYIANFGAHPVNLGWDNSELSADFPYYIEQQINLRTGADFLFIQGAIGGGIGCNLSEENGISQSSSGFEKMQQYSQKVADILIELSAKGESVEPILNVRHAQVEFELNNFVFKLAERAKICNALAYRKDCKIMLTSEIGYVEIGKDIKILEAPGEPLPELIYGGFLPAEQAYNKNNYNYPALNTLFDENDDVLVFGLCNDALGYFVPDNDYTASNSEGHYEETVSTGSTAASSLSKAFIELISNWR